MIGCVDMSDQPGTPVEEPGARVITVTAVVLRRADGRVATVRKRGTDRFMHPGGKPEPGESPAETGAREIGEELGVVAEPAELEYLGRFETATANEPGFVLRSDVFALAREVAADEPAPRAEIAELRWVDPADVADLDEADCAPWAPLFVRVAGRWRGEGPVPSLG